MVSSRKNSSRKNGVSRKNSSSRGYYAGVQSIFGRRNDDSSRRNDDSSRRNNSSSRRNGVSRKNSSSRGYYAGVDSIFGGGSKVGSYAQVFHGTAEKTKGGLKKDDLMQNKHGRIVSRRKHEAGKKAFKHLKNLGFAPKKGEFKLFTKKASRKSSRKNNN